MERVTLGTGVYVPPTEATNHRPSLGMDTPDQRIRRRTRIATCRQAGGNRAASGLAAPDAVTRTGIDASEIG